MISLIAQAMLVTFIVRADGTDFRKLGSDREAFGDPPITTSPGHFSETFEPMQTEMYFPEGRADQRFYINGGGGGDGKYRLEYETSHHGLVHLDWVLLLTSFTDNPPATIPKEMTKQGTLVKMLYLRGLKIAPGQNSKFMRRLNVNEGYGAYSELQPESGKFFYWYVSENGRSAAEHSIQFADVVKQAKLDHPDARPTFLPHLGIPYPISAEEMQHLVQTKPHHDSSKPGACMYSRQRSCSVTPLRPSSLRTSAQSGM